MTASPLRDAFWEEFVETSLVRDKSLSGERIASVEWSSADERSHPGFHPPVTRRRLQLPDTAALLGTKWIQMSVSITLNTKMSCVRDAVK